MCVEKCAEYNFEKNGVMEERGVIGLHIFVYFSRLVALFCPVRTIFKLNPLLSNFDLFWKRKNLIYFISDLMPKPSIQRYIMIIVLHHNLMKVSPCFAVLFVSSPVLQPYERGKRNA